MVTKIRNFIRSFFLPIRYYYLKKFLKINLHLSSIVSWGAFIDKTAPTLVSIGENTIITRGAVVLSHDYSRGISEPTIIGKKCFIGVNSIVMPGVCIGDEVVVGAGSVVTNDIASNSLVVGNPARTIRKIKTDKYGRIVEKNY
mgnify:CR=1 FL=1